VGQGGWMDEVAELQRERARGGEVLFRMWGAAAPRLPRLRPWQSRFRKILLGMRRAACAAAGAGGCRHATALCFCEGVHAKTSRGKNSHLTRRARRRAQAGDGAVRGFEGLD